MNTRSLWATPRASEMGGGARRYTADFLLHLPRTVILHFLLFCDLAHFSQEDPVVNFHNMDCIFLLKIARTRTGLTAVQLLRNVLAREHQ